MPPIINTDATSLLSEPSTPNPSIEALGFACPLPLPAGDRILLGHGSGGKLSAELVKQIFLPALGNPILNRLEDQAIVHLKDSRLAITTDSFVVKPLFFKGGDIGSLAVHGTINDLAMGGAKPLWLTAAFILEEGLPIETVRRIAASMQQAAANAGVPIITGDTKVVEKGSADGVFINTTGIGLVPEGLFLSAEQARPGGRHPRQRHVGRSRYRHPGRARRVAVRNGNSKRFCSIAYAGGLPFGCCAGCTLHARSYARRTLQHAE